MMVWNIEFTKEAQKDIRKLREPSKSHVNEAINKVVNSPETAKKIADSGAELITGTPEDMAKLYASDRARLAPIVKSSGTTLD